MRGALPKRIKVGLKALLRLRTDLYTTLHALPLKFHDMRRSTDSSFRVAYDSQSIQTFYNRGFTSIFGSTVMLISALTIMAKMDWKLTAISMGVIPFVIWALKHYADRIRAQSTHIQERESAVLMLDDGALGRLTASSARAALVRPDGYFAWSSDLGSDAALDDQASERLAATRPLALSRPGNG